MHRAYCDILSEEARSVLRKELFAAAYVKFGLAAKTVKQAFFGQKLLYSKRRRLARADKPCFGQIFCDNVRKKRIMGAAENSRIGRTLCDRRDIFRNDDVGRRVVYRGVPIFNQRHEHRARLIDNITYTRTLPNLEWNSLFVPFEIPVSDLTDYYDVAYINDIHSYDKDFNGEIDQMEMEVIYIKEGTLHANHPYLIRAKNDEAKEMNIVVTDATLYRSAKSDRTSITCSSAYTNFEIIGTYEKMSAQELDGCYAINTSGAWSPIASGASLNPFRLYMTITNRDGSPVKVSESAMSRINIRVQGEDTETGITETENGKVKTESFDLSGRRVERMQKGIYIVNGKKVVR